MGTGLPDDVRAVGEGFWNVRGSLKLGPVDLGTQASLVRLSDGRFVFLDAYTLDDETLAWARRTIGDAGLAAVIHLHPFHTLHVDWMHRTFPEATAYGTVRHHDRFPGIPWADARPEDPDFGRVFGDDLVFSVPQGVDFVPRNEHLHFASVLALHPSSRVLHVDDTLVFVPLPKPIRWLKRDVLRLHPTLRQVLRTEPGAAAAFRAWTDDLIALARGAETLCAAHSGTLSVRGEPEDNLGPRVAAAVAKARFLVESHERAYG